MAPNFFEQNENDGKSQIVEQYRVGGDATVGEPPADMVDDVKSAAEGCPVGAIMIEE